MNIAAAWHCYQVARGANNRDAALRHLHRIRSELRARRLKNIPENIPNPARNDRVRSIFDAE